MSDNTPIEWTNATWNIVTGCTRVSEGCEHCYIDRQPPFRMAHNRFDAPGIGGSTRITLHPERLEMPLRWRAPRRVFVNSLSDLFHQAIPGVLIAQAFAVMLRTPQHTYQILTKRPARMRSMMNSPVFREQVVSAYVEATGTSRAAFGRYAAGQPDWWPLRNVWLGVSVEDQHWASVRIPLLTQTPAAVRFLSCEPLLGEVRLDGWLSTPPDCGCWRPICSAPRRAPRRDPIDWVIIGGESGPGARPMDTLWAMDLVVQCSGRHIPVFVKQLGSAWAKRARALDSKGGTPEEWPVGLALREFPQDGGRSVSGAVAVDA